VVSSAEIARCPLRSLQPEHYREEGTCLCQPEPELRVWTGGEEVLVITGPAGPLVTIYLEERRLEFHEDYTPDAAARAFWENLVDPAAWERIVRAAVAEMEAEAAADA
jgi:hypothetical protein